MTFALLSLRRRRHSAARAHSPDQIRVVRSSTVYPFTTAVAEQFGHTGGKTPVVESTEQAAG
jgi:phosphate transport system substrate-binding protein